VSLRLSPLRQARADPSFDPQTPSAFESPPIFHHPSAASRSSSPTTSSSVRVDPSSAPSTRLWLRWEQLETLRVESCEFLFVSTIMSEVSSVSSFLSLSDLTLPLPSIVTGARPFYDLTNPIVYHRDEATIADVDEPKVTVTKRPRRPSEFCSSFPLSFPLTTYFFAGTGRQDFYDYAANLLDSVATSSPELVANAALSPSMAQRQLTSPTIMESVPSMRPERRDRSRGVSALLGGGEEEEGAGCKNAVEIVTRNSQKGECHASLPKLLTDSPRLQSLTTSTRMATWSLASLSSSQRTDSARRSTARSLSTRAMGEC